MLISDLALLEEPFRQYVEMYATDQQAFFDDFTKAWVKLQENGCNDLCKSIYRFVNFFEKFRQS